jgi:FK506-binding protein 1
MSVQVRERGRGGRRWKEVAVTRAGERLLAWLVLFGGRTSQRTAGDQGIALASFFSNGCRRGCSSRRKGDQITRMSSRWLELTTGLLPISPSFSVFFLTCPSHRSPPETESTVSTQMLRRLRPSCSVQLTCLLFLSSYLSLARSVPKKGDTVTIHYVGTLQATGAKFDSSRDRSDPFKTAIGVGRVIKGWDEGVPQLSIGQKAKLICTPDYAYGANGYPPSVHHLVPFPEDCS